MMGSMDTTCDASCAEHCGKSCNSWGILVLRLAAGAIFMYHGYGKLFGSMPGMTGFTGMVSHMGFPIPIVFAYAVAIVEFFGGLAIILGLCTRFFAFFGAIDMLIAFGMVMGFSLAHGGLELMLLASMVTFTIMGAGRISLDARFGLDKMMMKKKMAMKGMAEEKK